MRASAWHRALLILGSAVALGVAQDNIPPPDQFLRRVGGRISVIGDHLYYDGGEVSQEGYTDFRHSNQLNVTLSIDLSESWSTKDVTMRSISRPADTPVMFNQAILTDESSGTFYVWGGFVSWFASLPGSSLWKFTANADGGGSWNRETPNNPDTFVNLDRVENGVYVSTPSAGFVFGGRSTDRTTSKPSGNVKGFVSFDFTTRSWQEHSEAPYSPDGTLWGAAAIYVPTFGPNGLVFLLGGMSRREEEGAGYIELRRVHFFDPVTKEWFSQSTTGDIPGARHQFCVGGAPGANGTYDIFIHGGANDDYKEEYGDIHVLSLPGFRWTTLADDVDKSRAEVVCEVIGNRQFLTWGGFRHYGEADGIGWESKDPNPQGLAIFDMTEGVWKDDYDADAAPYEAHKDVAAWYEKEGTGTVEWTSDKVSALFMAKAPSESGDPNGDDNDGESSSSSPPVAAIVGGVVGGVVGFALIATAVWFFCLRKRGEQQPAQSAGDEVPQHHTPATSYATSYMPVSQGTPSPAPYYVGELQGNDVPVELMDSGKYADPVANPSEMPAANTVKYR